MIISLPEEIRTCREGFRTLGELCANCLGCDDTVVKFDCSEMRFVDANLCAALGVVFKRLASVGKSVGVVGEIKPEVREILTYNNFLSCAVYGEKTMLPDPEELEFSEKLFLPYWNYSIDEAKGFIKGYARKLIANKWMPVMTEGVRTKMIESLGELFNNAKVHAESRFGVFVCGKYSPKRQTLSFTISDAGIGFRERLARDFNFSGNSSDAIDWAMKPKNTVKRTDEPGGLGLKLLHEFVWLNGGRMIIASDAGYFELSNGEPVLVEFEHPFPGTIVSLEVNAADSQSYSLKTESVNNGERTYANSNN